MNVRVFIRKVFSKYVFQKWRSNTDTETEKEKKNFVHSKSIRVVQVISFR